MNALHRGIEENLERVLALMDALSVAGYKPTANLIDWLYEEGCED